MNAHIIARKLDRLISRIAKNLVEDAHNEAISKFNNRNVERDKDNLLHHHIMNQPSRTYRSLKWFGEFRDTI